MLNRNKLDVELREVLRCPVKWEAFLANHHLIDQLYKLWLAVVLYFPEQVRSEGDLVNELALPSEDLFELEADLINLKSWIDKARGDYLRSVVLFHRIEIIDRNGRGKHWPNPTWTRDQIIARSSDKEAGSLFFLEMKPHWLDSVLQALMGKRFCEFLRTPKKHYYVDFGEEIGATNQLPTNMVCFEVDRSTPSCYAYPVSASEVKDMSDCFDITGSNRDPYTNPPRAGTVYVPE